MWASHAAVGVYLLPRILAKQSFQIELTIATGEKADGRERMTPSPHGLAILKNNISSAMLADLRVLLYYFCATWAVFHSQTKLSTFNGTIICPHNKCMRKSHNKYRSAIYPPENERFSFSLCDGCGN